MCSAYFERWNDGGKVLFLFLFFLFFFWCVEALSFINKATPYFFGIKLWAMWPSSISNYVPSFSSLIIMVVFCFSISYSYWRLSSYSWVLRCFLCHQFITICIIVFSGGFYWSPTNHVLVYSSLNGLTIDMPYDNITLAHNGYVWSIVNCS